MNRGAWALERAEWQRVLFGDLNRAELIACAPAWPCTVLRVRVHRNHGIEAISTATPPFAAWNGLAFQWSFGSYDDSLAFDLRGDADCELIWLDRTRLNETAAAPFARWLAGRLRALRASTDNPILVAVWPLLAREREIVARAAIPGTYVADLEPLAEKLGERWLDQRTEAISGTGLSNRACLEVARALACRWLPAAVLPRRKAIAVDLDGTLYRGVLAEDGCAGLTLTPEHRSLQEGLVRMRDDGVLLALVSRNQSADVEQLFASRTDFPLRLRDFSAVDVSWDDRPAALTRIAERLRIGADAIVFVDDNPGGLAAAASSLPLFTVHASPDAGTTAVALAHVAGLFRWRETKEDRLRADDLRVAPLRAVELGGVTGFDEYLESLQVRLRYHVGRPEHLRRVADLVAKTNQFNLALNRMNEAQIARRLAERRQNVVAMELCDRLSDSGIVGTVVGSRHGDVVCIEELCVSCRALGRRLEDSMLTRALLILGGDDPPGTVLFDVRAGARNEPARQWLAKYAGASLDDDTERIAMPFAALAAKPISPKLRIEIVS